MAVGSVAEPPVVWAHDGLGGQEGVFCVRSQQGKRVGAIISSPRGRATVFVGKGNRADLRRRFISNKSFHMTAARATLTGLPASRSR